MSATYTKLTGSRATAGSIKNWANHSNIPSDEILDEAEVYIYERLRVREMLVTTQGTATASQQTIGVPTGFRAPYLFKWTGTNLQGVITRKTLDYVDEHITYDGTGLITLGAPTYYAIDASNIVLPNRMFEAVTYDFRHFAALVGLSTDTETNFLTDRFPRMLRAVCLGLANEWKQETQEKIHWLKVAEQTIFEANVAFDEEMWGGDISMEIP